jgi:hypothetical protein
MNNKPFDTSLKELIEQDPLGWATFFSPLPVESAWNGWRRLPTACSLTSTPGDEVLED